MKAAVTQQAPETSEERAVREPRIRAYSDLRWSPAPLLCGLIKTGKQSCRVLTLRPLEDVVWFPLDCLRARMLCLLTEDRHYKR